MFAEIVRMILLVFLAFPTLGMLLVNPCCCSCQIIFDDFDRVNSTNMGSNWSEDAGDWSIDSNTASVSTAGAKLKYTAVSAGLYVEAFATVNGTGKIRLALGSYGNDYVAVELDTSANKLRLFTKQSAGGSEIKVRECDVTPTGNDVLKFRHDAIASNGPTFVAYLNGTAKFGGFPGSNFSFGTDFYLATGDSVSTAITFDDVTVNKSSCYSGTNSDPSCPTALESCWPIVGGVVPNQIQADVSGVSGFGFPRPCDATECGSLNGTYVLTQKGLGQCPKVFGASGGAGSATGSGAGLMCWEISGLTKTCSGAVGATFNVLRLVVGQLWNCTDDAGHTFFGFDCNLELYFADTTSTSVIWRARGQLGGVGTDTGLIHNVSVCGDNPNDGIEAAAVTIIHDDFDFDGYGCEVFGQAVLTPL